jgi:fatty-acyl-CoA synthase
MPIASLQDILAIERVPLDERNIPRNTYGMLEAGASLAPDAPALTFFGDARRLADATVWTHREWIARITQAAHLFRRLGVERDDAVAFVLPNLPETHLTIWGAEAAGIAFAVNPLQEREHMAALLKAVEPKVLVTLAPTPGLDLFDKATEAATGLSALRCLLTVSLAPYAPAPARGALREYARSRTASLAAPRLEFETELQNEPGDALAFARPDGNAISSYFCTGGTTGAPKIARRTHFSETFDCWALTKFAEGQFAAGKTIFCGLPLFHVNGQLVTGLAPWSAGAHVVMGTPQGYRGEGVIASFWEIVERFRVNVFSGVPTVYSSLLQAPVAGRDIASLECGFCGAAPMPVQLFKSFQEQTGVRIVEG